MRLDHFALRVPDRKATAKFLQEAFGYKVQAEFQIDFDDGTKAECIALEPGEKTKGTPWIFTIPLGEMASQEYHMPPEIFVSDGEPGSIVGDWVKNHGGVGGVHHFAWQVDDVEATMKLWKEKGWAEFTSEKPMSCDSVTQVFTKPLAVCGGVIHEFIKRDAVGFCRDSVRDLMISTKGL